MGAQMSEGLLRQRRNFLLCSLILFGFLFLNLKITKISIIGIGISIQNPSNIFFVIVFFWVYFFWRYHQYSRMVSDFGVIQSFNKYYNIETRGLLRRKIERDDKRLCTKCIEENVTATKIKVLCYTKIRF